MNVANRTLAQIKRSEVSALYPPRLGDVMQAAWRGLSHQYAWKAFRAQVPKNQLPELLVVGTASPEAFTCIMEDGSSLVTINDGLIRFVENVCQALFSSSTFRGRGGRITEPAALGRQAADDLLVETYQQWTSLQEGTIPKPQAGELGKQAREMARHHQIIALRFIALHEIAHATRHRGRTRSPELELDADAWALDMLLSVDGRPTIQQNLVLSGAVVSLRTLAALESLGLWHAADYPPSGTRFKAILDVFRRRSPDTISFFLASTYAFTLDLRMEAVESALRLSRALEPVKADDLLRHRILSHIVSLLMEGYLGRMTVPGAAEIANKVLSDLGLGPGQAGKILDQSDAFSTEQPSYTDEGEWSDAVRFVIDHRYELQPLLR